MPPSQADGQPPAPLRPGAKQRAEAALPLVIIGGVLRPLAMDLGGRRDEVQGHWASIRQRQHPDQFHPGPGQLGHRPQHPPGLILTQGIRVGQVAVPRQHRLCQGDQQLAAAQPPPAPLEAPHSVDGGVQPRHQLQLGVQVPDQQQPGVAGHGRIVGAAVNGGDGCGTLHPLGASYLESMGVLQLPLSKSARHFLYPSPRSTPSPIHCFRSDTPLTVQGLCLH